MSYRKGRRFEWEVRKLLEERGYVVIRAARSKPVDLVAMKEGEILLIECKYDSYLSKERKEELIRIAEKAGATPILAAKRRYNREVDLLNLKEDKKQS